MDDAVEILVASEARPREAAPALFKTLLLRGPSGSILESAFDAYWSKARSLPKRPSTFSEGRLISDAEALFFGLADAALAEKIWHDGFRPSPSCALHWIEAAPWRFESSGVFGDLPSDIAQELLSIMEAGGAELWTLLSKKLLRRSAPLAWDFFAAKTAPLAFVSCAQRFSGFGADPMAATLVSLASGGLEAKALDSSPGIARLAEAGGKAAQGEFAIHLVRLAMGAPEIEGKKSRLNALGLHPSCQAWFPAELSRRFGGKLEALHPAWAPCLEAPSGPGSDLERLDVSFAAFGRPPLDADSLAACFECFPARGSAAAMAFCCSRGLLDALDESRAVELAMRGAVCSRESFDLLKPIFCWIAKRRPVQEKIEIWHGRLSLMDVANACGPGAFAELEALAMAEDVLKPKSSGAAALRL